MRAMFRVLALISVLVCAASAAEEATVGGEVEKPGKMDLSKAATLREMMEAAMPFQSGATSRIRVFRGATIRELNLKKFPDFRIEAGDVVVLPQKVIHEEACERHFVMIPGTGMTVEKIGKLLSGQGREVRDNWRAGKLGTEVRPEKGKGGREWDWVFVRMLPAAEVPARAVGTLEKIPGYQKGSEVAEITVSGYSSKFSEEVLGILRKTGGCRFFEGSIFLGNTTEFPEWPH